MRDLFVNRRLKTNLSQFFTIIVMSFMLSACGFHLRGDYLLPTDVKEMSLTSYDDYSTVTKELRKELRTNDINIVKPSSQTPNLHLIDENDGDTTVSIYQNSRAAEKQLNYSVQYQITIPGKGTQKFATSVTRSYLDNPQASLAKSIEEDLLLDEMRQEAVQQILRQMARLKTENDATATNEVTAEEKPKSDATTEMQVTTQEIANDSVSSAQTNLESQSKEVQSSTTLQPSVQSASDLATSDEPITPYQENNAQ